MTIARILKLVAFASALGIGVLGFELALRVGLVSNPQYDFFRSDGQTKNPKKRLLLLGDSFVDKSGGNFHAELVGRLGPVGYEIVNLAMSGTGPEEYLNTLMEHGARVRPDVTVVFYFAGNDFINVLRYEERRTPGLFGKWRDSLRPYIHRMYLYHALTANSPPEFDFAAMLADGHDPELVDLARRGALNPWLLLIPRNDRRHYLKTNLELVNPEFERGVNRLGAIFEELRRKSAHLGTKLLVVVFPATTQVSSSHFGFYTRAGFDPNPLTLAEAAPQRMIAGIATSLELAVLDLLPAFRAHSQEALYRPYDSHLNERGNALSAELVARFILDH